VYNRKPNHPRILLDVTQQLSIGLTPPGSKSKRLDCNEMNWLDVSEIASGVGFHTRVIISIALSDALTPVKTEIDGDYDQRLWDALWLAHFKLSVDQSQSATFNFSFTRKHWKTEELIQVSLRLHAEVKSDKTQVGLLENF